jgi:hypothetical protein
MYQPVPYSPVTAIAAAIGASDTTIVVDDGSLLGDAPNVAVIGISADLSETIVYGAKNGNILSNIQRGVQGFARSWSVGDPIARNFTALDQSNIQGNINLIFTNMVNRGDYGLGIIGIQAPNNLNSIETSGFYRVESNTLNSFSASINVDPHGEVLIHLPWDANTKGQIAISPDGSLGYRHFNFTWQPWRKVATV